MHESTQALALIDGLTLVSLIADKGYDNDAFRVHLAEAEIDAVIPPLGSRKAQIAYDANAYGLRHRVECFINKITLQFPTFFKKNVVFFFLYSSPPLFFWFA